MVGPIWGNPQSKISIKENSENNNNDMTTIIITLLIVVLVLYIANRINKYFKMYVHKHKNINTITNV